MDNLGDSNMQTNGYNTALPYVAVGTDVWDLELGKGTVSGLRDPESEIYHIGCVYKVGYCTILRWYSRDGRTETSVNRMLYYSEPVVTGDVKPKFVPTVPVGTLMVAEDTGTGAAELFKVSRETSDAFYSDTRVYPKTHTYQFFLTQALPGIKYES
jgi:hypothetical protein